MTRRPVTVLLLVVVTALAGVACGGSGHDVKRTLVPPRPTATRTPITNYPQRICDRYGMRAAYQLAAEPELPAATTLPDAPAVLNGTLDYARLQADIARLKSSYTTSLFYREYDGFRHNCAIDTQQTGRYAPGGDFWAGLNTIR